MANIKILDPNGNIIKAFTWEEQAFNFIKTMERNEKKMYRVSINDSNSTMSAYDYYQGLLVNKYNKQDTNTDSLKNMVESDMQDLLSKMNTNEKPMEKKDQSNNSWIYLVLLVLAGVYFYNKNNGNSDLSIKNTTTNSNSGQPNNNRNGFSNESENITDTAVEDKSSDNNSNLNSSNEDQSYTCLLCNGSGQQVCSTCQGKGSKLCRSCNGLGYIQYPDGNRIGCSKCLNSGIVDCKKYEDCPSFFIGCGGSGLVDKEKHIQQNKLLDIDKKFNESLNK